MNVMYLRPDQSQNQNASPRLQHAVRLLHMASLDYAAMVRETIEQNPFLETDEVEDGGSDAAVTLAGDSSSTTATELMCERIDPVELGDAPSAFDEQSPSQELSGADVDDVASIHGSDGDGDGEGNDRDLWAADAGSGQRRGEDGEFSALDRVAAETALNSHLHSQLRVLPLRARELALSQVVVESLDDDGYLRTSLDELQELAEVDPPATVEDMHNALRRVQSLDPLGVAARSVCECLELQLPAIECAQMRKIARSIVCDHLPLLASRDVPALARLLDETPECIESICDRIRRLDPRPGWRFGSTRVEYVVPDVIVRKVRGQWAVHLNLAVVPKVRLNQVYAQLFQRHRSAQNVEMGAHLNEARWTVRNVEQRFSTILDVAQAIVKRQKNFFEYGAMAMKPLGLREIADEVGVHESTVSRVTNNKYMSTPLGVFELKHFFSRVMVTANGGACSGTAIRGLIKEIIDAENIDEPLSDAQINRQLAQQGLVVARRTVTKYRQMLKIDAVERRRRHAAAA